jgi:hypothetical protein
LFQVVVVPLAPAAQAPGLFCICACAIVVRAAAVSCRIRASNRVPATSGVARETGAETLARASASAVPLA